jgi:hypothetical protein
VAELSFLGKRILVGVMLLVALFGAANYVLKWHLFGSADKQVLVVCFVVLAIVMLRWLPTRAEWDEYRKKKNELQQKERPPS